MWPRRTILINRDSSQAKGLVGWWPTAPYRASSRVRNVINIDASGSFVASPTWVPSRIVGWAIDFNGTSDYVNIGAVPSFPEGNNPRSFALWFYVDVFGNGTQRCLWTQNTVSGAGAGFRLHTVTNALGLAFNSHRNVTTTTALTAGIWYHAVVVVPNGATTTDHVKVYINGIEQALSNTAGSPQTLNTGTTNVRFANGRTGSEFHDGRLADLRLYSRALSPVEIWQMWNPATRWQLYKPTSRIHPIIFSEAAAVGGEQQKPLISAILSQGHYSGGSLN